MSGDNSPRFYGRRHGRRLRAGRERLLHELLPRIAVPAGSDAVEPRDLFEFPVDRCWLEIGFGSGEHLAAQAHANPRTGLIGCEPFVNGIARLLSRIDEQRLGNVRIFPDDTRLLLGRLPPASIGRVFVLFPDPWPKKRHAGRRIVAPEVLDQLARIMVDGAELRLASDEMGYIRWMLQRLQDHPAFAWTARGPHGWRERPPDWPPTRYEEKAVAAGRRCAYLLFRRRDRADSP